MHAGSRIICNMVEVVVVSSGFTHVGKLSRCGRRLIRVVERLYLSKINIRIIATYPRHQ